MNKGFPDPAWISTPPSPILLPGSGPPALLENHDEAYRVWREAGVHGRILLHLDAHDDFAWTEDPAGVNIANFICPALREGLIREFVWVVPDRTWDSRRNLTALRRRLSRVLKAYPGERHLVLGGGCLAGAVLGKPFRVCTLAGLPRFQEPVLLDVDVDFLLIPRAGQPGEGPSVLPWCWPEEVVNLLERHQVRTDLATISYSVEGGYTPLKWKFLGDELALRLQPAPGKAEVLAAMELVGRAAAALAGGDGHRAEGLLLEARKLWPDSPVPEFHLAHLYADRGLAASAGECYRRALELDPSYRTPYNSRGWWCLQAGREAEAEREHRRTLIMDPEDSYAHLGLAQLACRRRSFREAEEEVRRALALNSTSIDAHRTLGAVLEKQGRYFEALQAYETALLLGLAGHKPLNWAVATGTGEHQLADPNHFALFALTGRIHARLGDIPQAIADYRMSLGGGWDGAGVRGRLALLYLRRGRVEDFLRETGLFLARLPREAWWSLQRRASLWGRRLLAALRALALFGRDL